MQTSLGLPVTAALAPALASARVIAAASVAMGVKRCIMGFSKIVQTTIPLYGLCPDASVRWRTQGTEASPMSSLRHCAPIRTYCEISKEHVYGAAAHRPCLCWQLFWAHTFIRQETYMKPTHTVAAILVASTALLTGCASTTSTPYNNGYNNAGYNNGYNNNVASGYGTIDSIQVVRGAGGTSGSGAVVGGLVGALVGNQVGSGSGRTAATVAGAVGGAVVGNNVEANRNANGPEMYQLNIRMDNGEMRSVTQDSVYDLRVGNRVRLVDGRVYRY